MTTQTRNPCPRVGQTRTPWKTKIIYKLPGFREKTVGARGHKQTGEVRNLFDPFDPVDPFDPFDPFERFGRFDLFAPFDTFVPSLLFITRSSFSSLL